MNLYNLAVIIGEMGDEFALMGEAFFFALMSCVIAWVIGQVPMRSASTGLAQQMVVLFGMLISFYKLKESLRRKFE